MCTGSTAQCSYRVETYLLPLPSKAQSLNVSGYICDNMCTYNKIKTMHDNFNTDKKKCRSTQCILYNFHSESVHFYENNHGDI